MTALLDLPPELLALSSEYFHHAHDVVSLLTTCHFMHEIIFRSDYPFFLNVIFKIGASQHNSLRLDHDLLEPPSLYPYVHSVKLIYFIIFPPPPSDEPWIPSPSLTLLRNRFPNLRHLSISPSDRDLVGLKHLTFLPLIRTLSLCPELEDLRDQLEIIQIEGIDFKDCRHRLSVEMWFVLLSQQFPRLQDFGLKSIRCLSPSSSLRRQQQPRGPHHQVHHCGFTLDEIDSFMDLDLSFSSLRSLQTCVQSGAEANGLLIHFPRLECLDLSFSVAMPQGSLDPQGPWMPLMINSPKDLPPLTSLTLSSSSLKRSFSVNSIEKIVSAFHLLQEFRCHSIAASTASPFSFPSPTSPSLEQPHELLFQSLQGQPHLAMRRLWVFEAMTSLAILVAAFPKLKSFAGTLYREISFDDASPTTAVSQEPQSWEFVTDLVIRMKHGGLILSDVLGVCPRLKTVKFSCSPLVVPCSSFLNPCSMPPNLRSFVCTNHFPAFASRILQALAQQCPFLEKLVLTRPVIDHSDRLQLDAWLGSGSSSSLTLSPFPSLKWLEIGGRDSMLYLPRGRAGRRRHRRGQESHGCRDGIHWWHLAVLLNDYLPVLERLVLRSGGVSEVQSPKIAHSTSEASDSLNRRITALRLKPTMKVFESHYPIIHSAYLPLVHSFPNLESLELKSQMKRIPFVSFPVLHSLRTLVIEENRDRCEIGNAWKSEDIDLAIGLERFPNLRSFTFFGSPARLLSRHHDATLKRMFDKMLFPSLRHLSLVHSIGRDMNPCYRFTLDEFASILTAFPRLESLELLLSVCSFTITNTYREGESEGEEEEGAFGVSTLLPSSTDLKVLLLKLHYFPPRLSRLLNARLGILPMKFVRKFPNLVKLQLISDQRERREVIRQRSRGTLTESVEVTTMQVRDERQIGIRVQAW